MTTSKETDWMNHPVLRKLVQEVNTLTLAERVTLVKGLIPGIAEELIAFARALIRARLGDPRAEVPSPTFTLVQTYDGGRFPLAHFDFYRLSSADELDEIGLDERVAHVGADVVEVRRTERPSRTKVAHVVKIRHRDEVEPPITRAILAAGLANVAPPRALDVMAADRPYSVIARAMHIHPTVSELVPTLLQQLRPMA